MSIVVLPCGGCGSISLSCRTRSASLSKCGFNEFGTPSSPPKVYLTATQSGTTFINSPPATGGLCLVPPFGYSMSWSGSFTYATGSCSTTDTLSVTITNSGTSCSSTINSAGAGPTSSCADALYAGFGGYGMEKIYEGPANSCPANCAGISCIDSIGTAAVSSPTVLTVNATATGTSGSASVTLSNEYTTLQLYNDTQTALSSATFGGAGSCSGLTWEEITSSDEKSITLTEVEYTVSFPAVAGGLSLYYDWYSNGSFLTTISVPLTAGQTSAIISGAGGHFPSGGTSYSDSFTNFRIACAA